MTTDNVVSPLWAEREKMNITMKRITSFEGFDAKEFCVKPSYWGYQMVYSYDAKEAMEEAKRLAEGIDGICIAIVSDDLGEYVLGESCNKGCSSKFIIFNAKTTGRVDAEVRAITFNTGRGALTRYWYDEWIKFQKGAIV